MSTADPISLAQAQRLAANADTILLRATRPADLETPIGAFLRLDDGGPAYLLESVEGGERLGRYSFLGVGPRRLLEVSGGQAPDPDPAGHGADLLPRPADRDGRGGRPAGGHPRLRPAPPRPADRRHAAVHRRRRRGARLRRGLRVRAHGPAPGARPGRRPDGLVHRDRPRPRLRPPDPHAVGDRLAPHGRARPRGSLSHRGEGHLRRARPNGATERRGAERSATAGRRLRDGRATGPGGRARSGRADQPRAGRVHPRGRGRQGRDRGRRGDPGRARPAAVVRAPGGPGDRGARSTASGSTARSGGSTRAPISSSPGRRRSRSWAPRRSCCSRSRATG